MGPAREGKGTYLVTALARHGAEEAPARSRKRGSRVTRELRAPEGGGWEARVGDLEEFYLCFVLFCLSEVGAFKWLVDSYRHQIKAVRATLV